MPKRDIDRFVLSKEKWIVEKLAKTNEQAERRSRFKLTYGDHITYRGEQYPITAKQGSRIGFDGFVFYVPPNLQSEQIKSACVKIYRILAKRDLTEKTLDFAKEMQVTPTAIRINSAKTRWGSCSSKKSLNYSWMLIMADDDLIDYVIVHELAHISELNHSARFWALVESIIPDYKERKQKLKALQHKLSGEDWG
jgi:hypothetical protein